MIVNLEIVSDVQDIGRRDFTLANKNDINPTNPACIIDGEFVSLTLDYQIARSAAGVLGFAVFAEKGRFDVQAIGKLTVLMYKPYEADTRVFVPGGTLALGQPLSIAASVDIHDGAGAVRTGLAGASGDQIVLGYVTRMPATNGGRLRFLKTLG